METLGPQGPLTIRSRSEAKKPKRTPPNYFLSFLLLGGLECFALKWLAFLDDDDYLRQVQNRKSRRLAILR